MNESELKHFVCPKTLAHLRLEVAEASTGEVLEGHLSSATSTYPIHNGIPSFVDSEDTETQTARSFAQKWSAHKYYRNHTSKFYTDWFLQRYGFIELAELQRFLGGMDFILDAGTGSGRDAANFAENSTATVFGADLAREALDIARNNTSNSRLHFVHADVVHLPFPDEFFDFINCDQVIHHTPDPRETFESLGRKLKSGGHICCYVYRKKAVLREFADDYVRERISKLPIDDALAACEGITRLGQALAGLQATVEVQEDIPILGIKKGRVDVQRLFHWHVMKCFWNDEFDFFTNNIINFDWYHPELCFRFEPQEFRAWFGHGWEIESFDVQEAGISCRARKV